MESAITEAFLQTVRGLVQKCMQETEVEARKYALVMKTLHGCTPLSGAGTSDGHRIQMLEGTLDSLLQEVGHLDSRLNEVEQQTHGGWCATSVAEPLGQDEVIDVTEQLVVVKEDAAVIADDAPAAPAPAPAPTPAPAPSPAPTPAAPTPAPAPSPAPTPAPSPAPTPTPAAPPAAPAEEEAEEAEEEEENTLEEITVDGKVYYKDEENMVYMLNEEGDLDDTPVGRYLVKTNRIKFFA